ncbi:hypothetical protein FH972_025607 [Carpinus fangiana]|uniref:Uncharacterized protein n=1 Tax=Carpinus fangiana TaxID=176857 RepID=A0A5N6L1I0_9ROSI|nr:hypothetical protein FH972_025607 [Carpinus fangiana]
MGGKTADHVGGWVEELLERSTGMDGVGYEDRRDMSLSFWVGISEGQITIDEDRRIMEQADDSYMWAGYQRSRMPFPPSALRSMDVLSLSMTSTTLPGEEHGLKEGERHVTQHTAQPTAQ